MINVASLLDNQPCKTNTHVRNATIITKKHVRNATIITSTHVRNATVITNKRDAAITLPTEPFLTAGVAEKYNYQMRHHAAPEFENGRVEVPAHLLPQCGVPVVWGRRSRIAVAVTGGVRVAWVRTAVAASGGFLAAFNKNKLPLETKSS